MFVFPPCRARYTEASLTWRQSTTPQHPLWLWTTRMDSTQTRPMPPRTTASTTIPLSTQQTVPGSPRSNVSTQSLSFSGAFKDANKFQYRLNQYLIFHILLLVWLVSFPSAPPRPATPEKFSMPHRCARFGPGGHLVQVLPNLPSAGQPALVDIYNLEVDF